MMYFLSFVQKNMIFDQKRVFKKIIFLNARMYGWVLKIKINLGQKLTPSWKFEKKKFSLIFFKLEKLCIFHVLYKKTWNIHDFSSESNIV